MGANQRFDLIPDLRIAFDLSVSLHEDPRVPREIRAIVGACRIAEPVIAENLRAAGVGCANFSLAVKKPIQLIEICGLGDLCGDDLVVPSQCPAAIHLNGEQHGNAIFFPAGAPAR